MSTYNKKRHYVRPCMEASLVKPEDLMVISVYTDPWEEDEGGESIHNAKSITFSNFESDDLASQETWGCDYNLEW